MWVFAGSDKLEAGEERGERNRMTSRAKRTTATTIYNHADVISFSAVTLKAVKVLEQKTNDGMTVRWWEELTWLRFACSVTMPQTCLLLLLLLF